MNVSELGADITLMAGGLAGLAITSIAILRDLGSTRSRMTPTEIVPTPPVAVSSAL